MKAIIITISVFLLLFIGSLGYVIGLNQGMEQGAEKITNNFPEMDYTPTAHYFENGQILYPDKFHTDTLIVRDADYFNKCMNNGKPKSADDMFEILNEVTVNYKQ